MISAIKELSKEPIQESAKPAANFLEACNLIFEKGLLNKRRINSMNSSVIQNIKKGMAFLEKWCHSHEQTGEFNNHILHSFHTLGNICPLMKVSFLLDIPARKNKMLRKKIFFPASKSSSTSR